MPGSKPELVAELRDTLARSALSLPGGTQRARAIAQNLRATQTTVELYLMVAAAVSLALDAERDALDRHDISTAMQEAAIAAELATLTRRHLGITFEY
jgi:5-carboxymethyl-2-hydroxymuconate isomerase